MPGLIAVFGEDSAEAVVRRAASPVLRRPWQRLVLAPVADGRLGLGFVGERGGVAVDEATGAVAVLDGELFSDAGVETGTAAAQTLLDCYLARGAAGDLPEGCFAAAVWNPAPGALTLATDRCGRRPLYVATCGGAFLVAGELKALLAAGLEPKLDLQAWAELLAYEHVLGERTPLAGVRLLPAATSLTLTPSGPLDRRERWRYRLEPSGGGEERNLVAEFGCLLERAVARRLDGQTALALSGGLDSRCLATILERVAPATIAVTYGAPGSDDLGLGAKIAARAGLPHRSIPLGPGYLARWAAATVWLAEGHIRCFHAHHLALRSLRGRDGLRGLLIGFDGDDLLRGRAVPLARDGGRRLADALHEARAQCLSDAMLEEVLTPAFAADLRGLARESLGRCLAEEEGDAFARVGQFVFREGQRRKVWPGAELFADDLAPRDPFHDVDLLEFSRRLPVAFRRDGRLERAYLSQFPALASLPSTKDGLKPGLSGGRRELAAVRVKAGRRARALAGRVLGPARWPDRRGIGDYAADLRRGGAELLAILLEPRTLARGQIRERAVRRLVAETLSGRARHTRMLGMLLTLELFQRQFLEGEVPTEAVEVSPA